MKVTRAVYRPGPQEITIYSDVNPKGETQRVQCKAEAESLLALVDPDAELEEVTGTVYGLLKSIGPNRGTQV